MKYFDNITQNRPPLLNVGIYFGEINFWTNNKNRKKPKYIRLHSYFAKVKAHF